MQKPWAEIFDMDFIAEVIFGIVLFKSTNHRLNQCISLRLLVKDEVENECSILLWDSFALLSNEITYKAAIEYSNAPQYHEMISIIIDEVVKKIAIECAKVENREKLRILIFLIRKLNKDPLAVIENIYAGINELKENIQKEEVKLNERLLLDTDDSQVIDRITSGLRISIYSYRTDCELYEHELASAKPSLSSTHLKEEADHYGKICLDLKRQIDNMYQNAYAILGERLVIHQVYSQHVANKHKNNVQKN